MTTSPVAETKPVKSAVLTCQEKKHWFRAVVRPAPDKQPRPTWWPADPLKAYGGEQVRVALAGVAPLQRLSADGWAAFDDIPAGSGSLALEAFFHAVDDAFVNGVIFHLQ